MEIDDRRKESNCAGASLTLTLLRAQITQPLYIHLQTLPSLHTKTKNTKHFFSFSLRLSIIHFIYTTLLLFCPTKHDSQRVFRRWRCFHRCRLHHPPTRPHQSSHAASRNAHAQPPSRVCASRAHSNAASATFRTYIRRRPHSPVGGRRRALFRGLRHHAPPDAVLHHPYGPLRRAQAPMDRPRAGHHSPLAKDNGGSRRRGDRGSRGEPRRRGHGANAGRWAGSGGGAAQLQGRVRRDTAHEQSGGGWQPVARLSANGESGDDRDGFSVGLVRPV